MVQARKLVILAGAAATALVVLRRGRHAARGHHVPGGILIGDAVLYEALSRLLLGPFLTRIAADVAAVAPDGARVLEVGCGPGHLSGQLAGQHDLEVTGLDLDPAMITRARASTDRAGNRGGRRPSFLVGDVASLAFPDGSFDLVVSTLSMHHWADRPPAWPRSAASCAPAAERSSGTSGPVSGHICSAHATRTSPIPSTTLVALRFGW
jgi:SAM-dependent methyltransferase